jgi:hypothetical protein
MWLRFGMLLWLACFGCIVEFARRMHVSRFWYACVLLWCCVVVGMSAFMFVLMMGVVGSVV